MAADSSPGAVGGWAAPDDGAAVHHSCRRVVGPAQSHRQDRGPSTVPEHAVGVGLRQRSSSRTTRGDAGSMRCTDTSGVSDTGDWVPFRCWGALLARPEPGRHHSRSRAGRARLAEPPVLARSIQRPACISARGVHPRMRSVGAGNSNAAKVSEAGWTGTVTRSGRPVEVDRSGCARCWAPWGSVRCRGVPQADP